MTAKHKLLELIKRVIKLAAPTQQSCNEVAAANMTDKETAVHEDQLRQQKFYEAWVSKTSWHLQREAIPILLSQDPQRYSDSAYRDQQYDDLWQHAGHCVAQGLLPVLNKTDAADEWRVEPVAIYKWATVSRIELPPQLSALMTFVISATKKKSPDNATSQTAAGSEKEQILGAALAILVNYPKLSQADPKQIQAQDILALLKEHETKLFGKNPPDLSPAIVSDVISQWLAKTL